MSLKNPQIKNFTKSEIREIIDFLKSHHTFDFYPEKSSLFAATSEQENSEITGYKNVWTRDNAFVILALWNSGEKEKAIKAVRNLAKFYHGEIAKIKKILTEEADANNPQNRPHVKFHADLSRLEENWPHAQNDALGYFILIFLKIIAENGFRPTRREQKTLTFLIKFLLKLPFWNDADSGHWEESRHISASSIGIANSALKNFRENILNKKIKSKIPLEEIDFAIKKSSETLNKILPRESIQKDQKREFDASLLFVILAQKMPKDNEKLAREIVARTEKNLVKKFGVNRYLGDAYWSKNYRKNFSLDQRAIDVSENDSARKAKFIPKTEAQWCIFDPILAIIYGEFWRKTRAEKDFLNMKFYLNRALGELVFDTKNRAFLAPEAYVLEKNSWVPNDQIPLLWTQANLLIALNFARKIAEAHESIE